MLWGHLICIGLGVAGSTAIATAILEYYIYLPFGLGLTQVYI